MDELEKFIVDKVHTILDKRGEIPNEPAYVATDSLAEVVEKLIILHIRSWMLEDSVPNLKSDEELGKLKRKIDTIFKVKRPSYIEAINRMLQDAVINGKNIHEQSIKSYKGFSND
jgi:hypothetical protein